MNNALSLSFKGVVVGMTLVAVALLGLQYAIAQTQEATSTPPVVEETAAPTKTEATTTEANGEEQNVASPTESTPEAQPEAPTVSLPDQAAIAAKEAAMGEVTTLQDEYFQKTGKYLQILKGNGLPDYENGNVTAKLGKNISDKAWVHVYEAPGGKGYQVFYEDNGIMYSIGYGPEALERTFQRSTAIPVSATSTPASSQ